MTDIGKKLAAIFQGEHAEHVAHIRSILITWSSGSASGAEPSSLAILPARSFSPVRYRQGSTKDLVALINTGALFAELRIGVAI